METSQEVLRRGGQGQTGGRGSGGGENQTELRRAGCRVSDGT